MTEGLPPGRRSGFSLHDFEEHRDELSRIGLRFRSFTPVDLVDLLSGLSLELPGLAFVALARRRLSGAAGLRSQAAGTLRHLLIFFPLLLPLFNLGFEPFFGGCLLLGLF